MAVRASIALHVIARTLEYTILVLCQVVGDGGGRADAQSPGVRGRPALQRAAFSAHAPDRALLRVTLANEGTEVSSLPTPADRVMRSLRFTQPISTNVAPTARCSLVACAATADLTIECLHDRNFVEHLVGYDD